MALSISEVVTTVAFGAGRGRAGFLTVCFDRGRDNAGSREKMVAGVARGTVSHLAIVLAQRIDRQAFSACRGVKVSVRAVDAPAVLKQQAVDVPRSWLAGIVDS